MSNPPSTSKIISGLIDATIISLLSKSSIVKSIEKQVGKEFVNKHLSELKVQLIKEIKPESNKKISKETRLSKVYKGIKKTNIDDTEVQYIETIKREKPANEYLINIVVPCRNSSNIIANSIELLISEISKSRSLDFNVIFQINSTRDDTTKTIKESLAKYARLASKVNIYILEVKPSLNITLPGSLNLGYKFIQTELKSDLYKNVFFSFWDDELFNLIPTPDSLFNSNLNELLSSPTNKAISGYMVDNRINISRWHEVSKGFSSDLRFIHAKPYLHGGSGTVMRIEDFPKEGIKFGGIADTDLSEHLLKMIGYTRLSKLDYKDWPLRSNPNAPVFHPIETDILKWTIKYLMYKISWENTYDVLNKGRNKIGLLWRKRIEENRQDFHRRINKYLINLSPEKILDREFMHFYYLTVQNIKNKKALYENLKSYRSRSLEIR